jgi:hypothetical protein
MEWSERLHIDYAKKGYCCSNHINYTPQMTEWLSWHEKVVFFRRYLKWVGTTIPQHLREAGNVEKDTEAGISGVESAEVGVPVDQGSAPLQQVTSTSTTCKDLSGELICTQGTTCYIVNKAPSLPQCTISTLKGTFGCMNFLEMFQNFLCNRAVQLNIGTSTLLFEVYTQLQLCSVAGQISLKIISPDKTICADPHVCWTYASSAFDPVLVLQQGGSHAHCECSKTSYNA